MPSAEFITSPGNSLIKDVRKAVSRGGLTEAGFCIAEGTHLVEEALRSKVTLGAMLVAETAQTAARPFLDRLRNVRVVILPDVLFASVAATETPQGLMALVEPRVWKAEELFGTVPLVVVLDGIQDPGNAGAIIRAAEAFGATGFIFGKGTVSPHNPRTLRASAGSLFRLPYVAGMESAQIVSLLTEQQCTSWAAMPFGPRVSSVDKATLTGASAFIIGSEGRGIGAAFLQSARPVAIRTQQVESLNAAVAAAILLYEASRQRSHKA